MTWKAGVCVFLAMWATVEGFTRAAEVVHQRIVIQTRTVGE